MSNVPIFAFVFHRLCNSLDTGNCINGTTHKSSLLIHLSVCSSVCLSVEVLKSRFGGLSRVNTRGFFSSPFLGELPTGLIPGFFFSCPFSANCPRLIPGFFFPPPFSSGLPRVNTRVFFFFLNFALFQRAHCVWQNRPLCISNGPAQG